MKFPLIVVGIVVVLSALFIPNSGDVRGALILLGAFLVGVGATTHSNTPC